MVMVFGSFFLGGERIIELFGVGLDSDVLTRRAHRPLGARPELMILIGDANWKLPHWLKSRCTASNRGAPGHVRRRSFTGDERAGAVTTTATRTAPGGTRAARARAILVRN